MQTITSLRLFPVVALLALAGCGDGGAPSSHNSDASAANVTSTTNTDAAAADTFEVTLAGPPHQGTHRQSGQLNCMVYNGLWQAHWEDAEKTGLSGLMLQLEGVPTSGGSSDKLTFSTVFGSQSDPDAVTAVVDVTGSEHGRDGRGTVTREGDGAVIRVEGTAQHGASVTAVLRCASVEVMS